MSVFFDKAEADAEAIGNLIKEIRRLTPMPLLQLKDGRVIRIESDELNVLSQDDIQSQVNELTEKLTMLNGVLDNSTDIVIPGTLVKEQPVPAPPAEPTGDATTVPNEPADTIIPEAPAAPEATPEAPAEPPVDNAPDTITLQ